MVQCSLVHLGWIRCSFQGGLYIQGRPIITLTIGTGYDIALLFFLTLHIFIFVVLMRYRVSADNNVIQAGEAS